MASHVSVMATIWRQKTHLPKGSTLLLLLTRSLLIHSTSIHEPLILSHISMLNFVLKNLNPMREEKEEEMKDTTLKHS